MKLRSIRSRLLLWLISSVLITTLVVGYLTARLTWSGFNNVRDMETDRRAGKRTLAVRLGRSRTRALYAVMVLVPFPVVLIPWLAGSLDAWVLLSWLVLPIALRLIKTIREHADGPTLNRALAGTAMMELVFCLLLSIGILAS